MSVPIWRSDNLGINPADFFRMSNESRSQAGTVFDQISKNLLNMQAAARDAERLELDRQKIGLEKDNIELNRLKLRNDVALKQADLAIERDKLNADVYFKTPMSLIERALEARVKAETNDSNNLFKQMIAYNKLMNGDKKGSGSGSGEGVSTSELNDFKIKGRNFISALSSIDIPNTSLQFAQREIKEALEAKQNNKATPAQLEIAANHEKDQVATLKRLQLKYAQDILGKIPGLEKTPIHISSADDLNPINFASVLVNAANRYVSRGAIPTDIEGMKPYLQPWHVEAINQQQANIKSAKKNADDIDRWWNFFTKNGKSTLTADELKEFRKTHGFNHPSTEGDDMSEEMLEASRKFGTFAQRYARRHFPKTSDTEIKGKLVNIFRYNQSVMYNGYLSLFDKFNESKFFQALSRALYGTDNKASEIKSEYYDQLNKL